MTVDSQVADNEKFFSVKERNEMEMINQRQYLGEGEEFKYESWMEPIIILNVMENMFDWETAVKLIRYELKIKETKHTELLTTFELRNIWTDIEKNVFRQGKQEDGLVEYNYENDNVTATINGDAIPTEFRTKTDAIQFEELD